MEEKKEKVNASVNQKSIGRLKYLGTTPTYHTITVSVTLANVMQTVLELEVAAILVNF